MSFLKDDRTVIVACDVDSLSALKELVKETCNVKGIGGYKIGFELVIPFGMKVVLKTIRDITKLPVMYDHQKAATDIPDTGEKFVKACKGIDAIILFPQAGPKTEVAWIKACQKYKIKCIVGGEMTHPGYLMEDDGFLDDEAPQRIYGLAAEMGVVDFVVPGNKPDKIKKYREFLEKFSIKPVFYSPGLVAQGGSLTQGAKAAGDKWHAIVGRGIYQAKDMKKAAEELCKELIS